MLHLSWQINILRQRVKDENLERRSNIWKIPYNCLADFPHLDETELRNITCGVYQLKLSSSYMQEYLEGNSEILLIKKMIIWYAFGYRVATHHPGHICYGSRTAQRKLPHGTANVEQEHELLEYALTSRPSWGTLDMQGTNRIYLTESRIGGNT